MISVNAIKLASNTESMTCYDRIYELYGVEVLVVFTFSSFPASPAHPPTEACGGRVVGVNLYSLTLDNRICFEDTANWNKYKLFIGPKCHLFREIFHDLYLEIFG